MAQRKSTKQSNKPETRRRMVTEPRESFWVFSVRFFKNFFKILIPATTFLVRNTQKLTARIAKSKLVRRCVSIFSSVAFVAMMALFIGFFNLVKDNTPDENIDLWQHNRPPTLIMLDAKGNKIGERGSRYGNPVLLEDMPPYLINAFIATEDRRFFEHSGIDIKGMTRALITNTKAGRVVQGGSTMTQQLVKNLFLNSEQTYSRKLQEAQLALWLEARYTKEEILSIYLNRTYLGAGAYGVEAAAQIYFSKSAVDLTLPEAAVLAGLPKAPSTLSPMHNFEGAVARSIEVIDNMVESGLINPSQAVEAKQTPPTLSIQNLEDSSGYFFDYAVLEVQNIVGKINQDVIITTTIDTSAQEVAEKIIRTRIDDKATSKKAEQAALVSYENDGRILAMVGGVSYAESQFNRATMAKRQPGSVFKPFVYLAALENGMNARTLLVDEPVKIGKWEPANYSGRYLGPIRMSEAMAKSVNSIAVQVTETVGREKVIEVAKRLGIKQELQPHASIALGAQGVMLSEITAAYLPFASGGMTVTPYAIEKIETRKGDILYERRPPFENRIIEPEISKSMNHLMYQVIEKGTGKPANLGKRQAAGKTGTTNEWKDAWFLGYTGQVTTGVWVGNDANDPMEEITGGSLPAQIWHDFMLAVHSDKAMLTLPGAYQTQTQDEELRLVGFYDQLGEDFAAAQYGERRQQKQRPRRRWFPW